MVSISGKWDFQVCVWLPPSQIASLSQIMQNLRFVWNFSHVQNFIEVDECRFNVFISPNHLIAIFYASIILILPKNKVNLQNIENVYIQVILTVRSIINSFFLTVAKKHIYIDDIYTLVVFCIAQQNMRRRPSLCLFPLLCRIWVAIFGKISLTLICPRNIIEVVVI